MLDSCNQARRFPATTSGVFPDPESEQTWIKRPRYRPLETVIYAMSQQYELKPPKESKLPQYLAEN